MKTIQYSHRGFLAVLGVAFAFATSSQAQIPTSNQLPIVSILAPDGTALEGTSTGAFTLLRTGPTNDALVVDFTISGTASNGVDYTTITSPITIPAGFYAIDIPVVPIIDSNVLGNKNVVLTLVQTNGTNATYALGRTHAKVEIIDDVFDLPPPTISLITPTNGSAFTSPASIVLTPDISDVDSQISSVSYFANDEFIGKGTNSTFTFTWNTDRSGKFDLFARVVDSLGRSALSTPVQITISNIVPEVSITSPTNHSQFTPGTNITVTATATDADSTVTQVSFFANFRFIGSATTSPYTITWSNAPAGIFQLEAIALAQNGKSGVSEPVQIKVTGTNSPRVTLGKF